MKLIIDRFKAPLSLTWSNNVNYYYLFFFPQGAAFSERALGFPAKEEHAYSVRLSFGNISVAMGGFLSALTSKNKTFLNR